VYAGRSDDMLKVSGSKFSPFEVEATLPGISGGSRAGRDRHAQTRTNHAAPRR